MSEGVAQSEITCPNSLCVKIGRELSSAGKRFMQGSGLSARVMKEPLPSTMPGESKPV